MRILVGTRNICGAVTMMAEGFRKLGLEVTTVTFPEHRPMFADAVFDVVLPDTATPVIGLKAAFSLEISHQIQELIESHDVFMFNANTSLTGHGNELEYLARLGKKVIIFNMGSEIRHEAVARPFFEAYGYEFPSDGYPRPGLSTLHLHPACLPLYTHSFAKKVYTARLNDLFATAIFGDIPTNLMNLSPLYAGPYPFPAEACVFRIPGRDVPHIVHAPSSRSIKRTDAILEALVQLKDEGLPFTLELLENKANTEVLAALANADILIDQIGSPGGMGRLSLEGLASGCAVLGCNNACVPYPPSSPVIRADPQNPAKQLRALVGNKDLRIHLAAQGRRWIQQQHTAPMTIAARMLSACAGTLPYDYYPTAFVELARIPEKQPFPDFLRQWNLQGLLRHGCHPDSDLSSLESHGLVPRGSGPQLDAVRRWARDDLHQCGPFAWCAKAIRPPKLLSNSLECHLHCMEHGRL